MKRTMSIVLAVLLIAGTVLAVYFLQNPSSGSEETASSSSFGAASAGTESGTGSQQQEEVSGELVALDGEMRAVWVPYLSLDQTKMGQGQQAFQSAFDEIVAKAKEYGLNTLIVHVRPF